MTDPLHLAALDFLTSSPAPMTALSPATPERRRFMLEDSGAALSFALEMFERPTGPAHEAALQVFAFAADVWGEYLSREANPDRAALNLQPGRVCRPAPRKSCPWEPPPHGGASAPWPP